MKDQLRKQTFDKWITSNKALLFKVVHTYAFNSTDREELFQEISMQIWNSIPRFKQKSSVSTWLYRIALNTAITWSGKERKHRDKSQSIDGNEHLLMSRMEQPDERLEWLYEEISKLNEVDRSLTLLLLDGFAYKEMADILGISEGSVGVKIHRIKKYLIEKSKNH